MGRFLIRLDDDLYVDWSTVSDAPVTRGMTLKQVKRYLDNDMDCLGRDKPNTLDRLIETGTSLVSGYEEAVSEVKLCNRAGPRERRLTMEELIAQVRGRMQEPTDEEKALAAGLRKLTKDGGITWKFGMADSDGWPGTDDTGWPWSEWERDPAKALAKLRAKEGQRP